MWNNKQNNSIAKKESLSRTTIPIIALIGYIICLVVVWCYVKNYRAQIFIALAALFVSLTVWLTNYLEMIRDLKGYFVGSNPSLKERTTNRPTTAQKGVLEVNAEMLIYNPASTSNIIYSVEYFLRIHLVAIVDYHLTPTRSHNIKIPVVVDGYKAYKYIIDLDGGKDIPSGFQCGQTKCELFCKCKTIFGKDLLIRSSVFIAGK